MNKLQIFKNEEFGEIRIVIEDGNTLFNANDVTNILGYSNGRDAVAKHCKSEGVAKRDTLTSGGNQSLTYLSEGNLYIQ